MRRQSTETLRSVDSICKLTRSLATAVWKSTLGQAISPFWVTAFCFLSMRPERRTFFLSMKAQSSVSRPRPKDGSCLLPRLGLRKVAGQPARLVARGPARAGSTTWWPEPARRRHPALVACDLTMDFFLGWCQPIPCAPPVASGRPHLAAADTVAAEAGSSYRDGRSTAMFRRLLRMVMKANFDYAFVVEAGVGNPELRPASCVPAVFATIGTCALFRIGRLFQRPTGHQLREFADLTH